MNDDKTHLFYIHWQISIDITFSIIASDFSWYTRAAPKALPLILLCWPMNNRGGYWWCGSRGFPPISRYMLLSCDMAAEGHSDKMVSDMEVHVKQRCVTEFLHAEKMAPTDIHWCLLNIYGDQTVHVSTLRYWVVHFTGDSNSGSPLMVQICSSVVCKLLLLVGENA